MASIFEEGRAAAILLLAPEGSNPDAAGQVVTLTFTIPGAYDEDTQATGPDTTVTQTCSGVEKAIDIKRIDGSLILEGDCEFVLSPVTTAGVDLNLPDKLPAIATLEFADGSKRSVVRGQPKRPSGLLISATLQLRG